MSSDHEYENALERAERALEASVKNRIQLAALALSDSVVEVRALRYARADAMMGDASAVSTNPMLSGIGFLAGLSWPTIERAHAQHTADNDFVEIIGEHDELREQEEEDVWSRADRAEAELEASKAMVRAAYGLSRFQLRRAVSLAEKNF